MSFTFLVVAEGYKADVPLNRQKSALIRSVGRMLEPMHLMYGAKCEVLDLINDREKINNYQTKNGPLVALTLRNHLPEMVDAVRSLKSKGALVLHHYENAHTENPDPKMAERVKNMKELCQMSDVVVASNWQMLDLVRGLAKDRAGYVVPNPYDADMIFSPNYPFFFGKKATLITSGYGLHNPEFVRLAEMVVRNNAQAKKDGWHFTLSIHTDAPKPTEIVTHAAPSQTDYKSRLVQLAQEHPDEIAIRSPFSPDALYQDMLKDVQRFYVLPAKPRGERKGFSWKWDNEFKGAPRITMALAHGVPVIVERPFRKSYTTWIREGAVQAVNSLKQIPTLLNGESRTMKFRLFPRQVEAGQKLLSTERIEGKENSLCCRPDIVAEGYRSLLHRLGIGYEK